MNASAAVPSEAGGVATLRRYRDVAGVLLKYGLADVVDLLHLDRYLPIGRHLVPARVRVDPAFSRDARFRLTLEELGPTFVKFGQALSVRSDLLPAGLVAEMAKLQDQAPAIRPGQAEAVLESALGRPVTALFRSFDGIPFAGGSMAQVHRAVLPSGEPVVVKVRRPGISRVIASDVEMLRQLARLAERYVPAASVVDPVGLVTEFARTIRLEQDLAREGRSIERCARNFEGDPTVRLPRVYWERTTEAVLTLEYLDGIKVSGVAASPAVSPFARRLIAQRGADAMVKQILADGFFHADPHPGNVFVLPDHVIGFLDFGIVGHLDERTRAFLARVIRAVAARDADRLSRLALEVSRAPSGVDTERLRSDMAVLLEDYSDLSLADLSMSSVLSDVVAVAARHRLRLPSNLMLLIKAVVTIESVGRQLDPTFKIVQHVAPGVGRLWRARHTPAALVGRVAGTSARAWSAVGALPRQIHGLLAKTAEGRLEVQLVHRNLDYFVREMDRSSNRLSFAVVIGALIIGSSFVLQSGVTSPRGGYPILGLAGFIVAGMLGIGLAIGIMRSGRL